MRHLWILTEERPKIEVLRTILELFSADTGGAFIDHLRIIPILTNNRFSFAYELIGYKSGVVDKVYIKTISGTGSFVDYLIYHQFREPEPNKSHYTQ